PAHKVIFHAQGTSDLGGTGNEGDDSRHVLILPGIRMRFLLFPVLNYRPSICSKLPEPRKISSRIMSTKRTRSKMKIKSKDQSMTLALSPHLALNPRPILTLTA